MLFIFIYFVLGAYGRQKSMDLFWFGYLHNVGFNEAPYWNVLIQWQLYFLD